MSTPPVRTPSPSPSPWSRILKVLAWALALVVMTWAWRVSGLNNLGSLWSGRERAADYILGQRIDESSLEIRRQEAEIEVRTDIQTQARLQLETEYQEKGQPVPSFMQLMKQSQELAANQMAALPPEEFQKLVEEKLASQGLSGGRRGGFFPPETDPKAVLGDPDQLGKLHWSVQWIVDGADRMGGTVQRAVRWIFSAVVGNGYTGELLETVAIALWGTLLAVIVSVPAAILGASRSLELILPGQKVWQQAARRTVKFSIRRSFDVSRGFNEIVLAMILVAVLGLGPLPGAIALLIHTYGVLGKVFSEAIEVADPKPLEGVQATGASWSQVISVAVLPQIMPYIASQSLLRFESNVRGATILGVVGGGGIGQLLMDKFGAFEFREVASMMIIIIVVVTLIDFACGRVMKSLR